MRDLVTLVPDNNTVHGLRGLLTRPEALGVRFIDVEFLVHPRRDNGCFREAPEFLRPFSRGFQHALVVFDRAGSGRDALGRDALAEDVRQRISRAGWAERADVIVIDPELEVWVFAQSPHVERCIRWRGRRGSLQRWLEEQGMWVAGRPKPEQPKEALERAMREAGRPRTSVLYECLGRSVSTRGCSDPAFEQLVRTLGSWFPRGGGA